MTALESKRRQLICPECCGPAFFRKASRSGRAACFGARPHNIGCLLAAQDFEQVIEGEGTNLDVLNNLGETIIVDLNFGAHANEVHGDASEGVGRAGRAPRYIGGSPTPNARMHRRLSSLLRTLIEAPQFRNSQQIIELTSHPAIPVRHFFVPLLAINTELIGQFRGWWGLISDARDGYDGSLWLNSGGRDAVSFCIPAENRATILERFRLEDNESLAGAYTLVIGELKISQHGKIYCIIESPNHIAIRLT